MNKIGYRRLAVGLSAGALVVTGTVALSAPANAAVATPTSCTSSKLFAPTSGATKPDDLAIVNGKIFVGYQNGIPSTGGANAAGGTTSTLYELSPAGAVIGQWSITGKIDGLGADPAHDRVIGTVNEDGNSSMFTVPASGGAPTLYAYGAGTPTAGGGTDAVSVFGGQIYTSASANSVFTKVPAVNSVTLAAPKATLGDSAIHVDSSATPINSTGAFPAGTPMTLAITDADSNTVVPAGVPNVGGSFMLNAQGDGQLIFASSMAPGSPLKVLNLNTKANGADTANGTPAYSPLAANNASQLVSVDDVAFPSQASGELISTGSGNSVYTITCKGFAVGQAFASITPCNANGAASTCTLANYIGSVDLATGTLTKLLVNGASFSTKGLVFLPLAQAPVPALAHRPATVARGPLVRTGAVATQGADPGAEIALGGFVVIAGAAAVAFGRRVRNSR